MSVTRIDREIGPRGYDPYDSASRDTSSALEWRWAVYTPGREAVVSFGRALVFDEPNEREMRQLP